MIIVVVVAATIILWSAYTLRAEGHGFGRSFDVGVLAALCRMCRRPAAVGSGPGCHLVEVVHSTPHSTGPLRGTHTERTPSPPPPTAAS